MRWICLFCLLPLVSSPAQAQPVKATRSQITCEALCAELFAAIRAEPEKMEMRLEEALVIHESCAAEIVTAAMDAVSADPAKVKKIVNTAKELAPGRTAKIAAAVKNYSAPSKISVEEQVEVRRAEISDVATVKLLPGEEVRRAEVPNEPDNVPIVEIRRAEPAVPVASAVQVPAATIQLLDVPKAKLLKTTR
ncbi:hypothetical protein [Prosthecobacter sp.]|uniref:hypothetical protein n=1 Tax=Prosthecobacter sp. TaxID=1965333 RepID=UPI001DF2E72E|nr:hypothetical protein [Prosthecobacter sp.]MCB1279544.1 hypothetical protein [Prosthecobacter sp.]